MNTILSAKQQRIFLTGAAGFVGMHTTKRLLAEGFEVIGLDNLNAYYTVSLNYLSKRLIVKPLSVYLTGNALVLGRIG